MAIVTFPLASGLEAAYNDSEARQVFAAFLAASGGVSAYSGVRPSGSLDGLAVTANGTPNNTVSVSTGACFNTPGGGTGTYITVNDSAVTLTAPPADASLLRKDAVFIDPSAAVAADRIVYIQGTPGSGSYPTLTGTRYRLANIDVRSILVAGGTIIRPQDIFDTRGFAAAMGGRLICTSSTRPSTPYKGMEIYETNTGLVFTYNGTIWASTNLTEVVTSTTRPGSPPNGKEIFETDTGIKRLWRSDQSKWQAVGGDVPICKLGRTTNASIANDSWTITTWESTIYDDPGGAFAMTGVGTGTPTRMTAKIAGLYHFIFNVEWANNSSGGREGQIRLNSAGNAASGTRLGYVKHVVSNSYQVVVESPMAVNDYIECFVYQNSGGSLDRLNTVQVSGRFIRDL